MEHPDEDIKTDVNTGVVLTSASTSATNMTL